MTETLAQASVTQTDATPDALETAFLDGIKEGASLDLDEPNTFLARFYFLAGRRFQAEHPAVPVPS